MTQKPSIRDLLATHLGNIKDPISVTLSDDYTEPEPTPALNGPELKQNLMQALRDDAINNDPAAQAAAQTQAENEAFQGKVIAALINTINNQDGN